MSRKVLLAEFPRLSSSIVIDMRSAGQAFFDHIREKLAAVSTAGGTPSRGSHRPEKTSLNMLAKERALPDIFAVPQRGVKDTTSPVYPAPGNRKHPRLPAVRVPIERNEEPDSCRIEALKLVDLLEDRECFRKSASCRMVAVDDIEMHARLIAVRVEFPSQHLEIRGEAVEGIGCAVNADESMASRDPREKRVSVGKRKVSGRIRENHRVVSLQGRLRHLLLEIGRRTREVDRKVVVRRNLSENLFAGLDRRMAEARGDGDDENFTRRCSGRQAGSRQDNTENGHQMLRIPPPDAFDAELMSASRERCMPVAIARERARLIQSPR